ncbi:DUF4373 domain-containing protein [Flintibacter porci]|uniref:DUF4373 domain-containing protein n=1 Tax=Flintibacter porci TaxID=3342383 RepID=UPI003F8AD6D6
MPKTNEKDAYFFSHDCNARNDPKILALRSVYGAEGYGVYFMLVEILREQPDYKLAVNKYIWSTLAMQMQVEASKLEQIINDCCTEFSENGNTLLVNDGEYLYSASLLRRMGKVDDISNLRREAARKRWENKPCKTSGNSDGCSDDANAVQEQSKEKKSKEKKSKAEQRKEKQNIFSDFACGDADLLSALQGFEEMRVKIKKPMTDQAKKRLLTELEKLAPGDRETQIAILHQSEDRCWAGVFALKDDRSGQIGGGRRQQASTGDKMGALRDLHDAFSGDGGV